MGVVVIGDGDSEHIDAVLRVQGVEVFGRSWWSRAVVVAMIWDLYVDRMAFSSLRNR